MRVAVVSERECPCGNRTTVERIAAALAAQGDDVVPLTPAACSREAVAAVDVLVLVHAVRCRAAAEHARALARPYVLIFGGTDVNSHLHVAEKRAVIETVVRGAACCVAFTPDLAERVLAVLPDVRERILVVPQAVVVPRADEETAEDAAAAERLVGVDGATLLLVAGLRPVKDPLWAIRAARAAGARLAIVGPPLDAETHAAVVAACDEDIAYHGPQTRSVVVAAMRRARALLNSSLSEGMSCAVMEALALGCVVVARRNAGNEALLSDGVTGLLIDSEADLAPALARLHAADGEHGTTGERLRSQARADVHARFGCTAERDAYACILDSLRLRTAAHG